MHCLFCVESSNQKLLEKQGVSFFLVYKHILNVFFFYQKHLENILNTLINLSTTLKKPKKQLKKSKINSNTKTFPWLDMPPQVRRKKKHLGKTSFIKWNPLTTISIILVVKIIVNGYFFYFHWILKALSLSYHKQMTGK